MEIKLLDYDPEQNIFLELLNRIHIPHEKNVTMTFNLGEKTRAEIQDLRIDLVKILNEGQFSYFHYILEVDEDIDTQCGRTLHSYRNVTIKFCVKNIDE